MARKKVSTTVYLTAGQVAALQRLSKRTRVPVAEYIRQGVGRILTANGETPVVDPHGAAVS